MYRFERSARIKPGKDRDALEFALKAAHHLEENYSLPIEVFTEYFGKTGTVYWHADYDELSSFERVTDKLRTDTTYNEILADVPDLFIEGSVKDTLLRSQSRK